MGNAHADIYRKKGGDRFQTEGSKIMKIAEAIRPQLVEIFKNAKNSEGLPVQPATIRGIALNVAQNLVKKHSN